MERPMTLGGTPTGGLSGAPTQQYYPPPPYEAVPGYPVSPKRAMWSDLLYNVGAVLQGQQPTSPHMSAMQQYHLAAQQQQQQAIQNQRLMRQDERDRYQYQNIDGSIFRVDRDTGAVDLVREGGVDKQREFEFAKANGYEGTYVDFLRTGIADPATANQRDFAELQRIIEMYGPDSPEANTFREMLSKSQQVDIGGGATGLVGATGALRGITDPEEIARRDAEQRSATKSAEEWATADVAFEAGANDLYDTLSNQLAALQRIENDIESGRLDDTGYFKGVFQPYVDQAAAELNAESTMATLEALQIVNLAPVTENEFAKLEGLWPGVRRDPQANLGVISAARRRTQMALQRLDRQLDYFYENGSLEGYTRARRGRPASPTSTEASTETPGGVEIPDDATVVGREGG